MVDYKNNNDSKNVLWELKEYWDYRADDYSKRSLEELNNFKRNAWIKVLSDNVPKKGRLKVLDVGTGPGFLAIIMALEGHDVTAVDISENMLTNAKSNAMREGVKVNFVRTQGVNLPFEDGDFDLVISRHVLWNLEYPERAMREWKRVLNSNGRLIYFDANWYLHLFEIGRAHV